MEWKCFTQFIQNDKIVHEAVQLPGSYYMYICLRATHSTNFDEKVHKPQSKSYGKIDANMQLILTHIL